jgi:hypothetical protein
MYKLGSIEYGTQKFTLTSCEGEFTYEIPNVVSPGIPQNIVVQLSYSGIAKIVNDNLILPICVTLTNLNYDPSSLTNYINDSYKTYAMRIAQPYTYYRYLGEFKNYETNTNIITFENSQPHVVSDHLNEYFEVRKDRNYTDFLNFINLEYKNSSLVGSSNYNSVNAEYYPNYHHYILWQNRIYKYMFEPQEIVFKFKQCIDDHSTNNNCNNNVIFFNKLGMNVQLNTGGKKKHKKRTTKQFSKTNRNKTRNNKNTRR